MTDKRGKKISPFFKKTLDKVIKIWYNIIVVERYYKIKERGCKNERGFCKIRERKTGNRE